MMVTTFNMMDVINVKLKNYTLVPANLQYVQIFAETQFSILKFPKNVIMEMQIQLMVV